MNRGLLVLVPLLLLAVSVSVSADDVPLLNHPAPSFDLPALDGGSVNLADQRGKIVVLHFGTGW